MKHTKLRWTRWQGGISDLVLGDERKARIYLCVRITGLDKLYAWWAADDNTQQQTEGWSLALSTAREDCERIVKGIGQ